MKHTRICNCKTFLLYIVIIPFYSFTGYSADRDHTGGSWVNSPSDNIIKVALLQINPFGADVEANLEKGDQYCRKAKALGADIVLFPEMWSIGYSGFSASADAGPLSFEGWKAKAIDQKSEFIIHFQRLASELDMSIIITYLEKWNGYLRNSASVIDSKGRIIMTYAKVHTVDFFLSEANCAPGTDFYVCDLPIRGNSVRLGIMICYDREFPESARILMLKGAELILTPNACGLDEQRINQFQSRAYENAVGVAMANYPQPFLNGHSCSFDCDGERILLTDEAEGVFIVPFDMGKIRSYRKGTIHGNAYRRPNRYHLLTSPEVDSVFIRNNALGERFLRENR